MMHFVVHLDWSLVFILWFYVCVLSYQHFIKMRFMLCTLAHIEIEMIFITTCDTTPLANHNIWQETVSVLIKLDNTQSTFWDWAPKMLAEMSRFPLYGLQQSPYASLAPKCYHKWCMRTMVILTDNRNNMWATKQGKPSVKSQQMLDTHIQNTNTNTKMFP